MFRIQSKVVTFGAALLLTSAAMAWADDSAPAPDAAAAPAEDPDLIGKDALPGAFVGNVTAVSDYLFRGISQTRRDPAIQGSIEYDHPSGIYVGAWGSSIDYADAATPVPGHAQLETDLYAGYRNSIGAWTYNFGGYGYYYVHTVGVNYAEGFGNLTYDFGFAQVTGGIYASPDNAFNSGTEVWGGGDIVVPVWKSLALDFHGGHQYIEKNANFGTPDYNEFSIAANALVLGFNVSLQYHDTDISKSQCFGGSDLCSGKVVVSVGRSF